MADENAVLLAKPSGGFLLYDDKDANGYYKPEDLDRNALKQEADGSFTEIQPNGLKLIYKEASFIGGGGASLASSASSATDPSGAGIQGNLIPPSYYLNSVGQLTNASSQGKYGEQPLCSVVEQDSFGSCAIDNNIGKKSESGCEPCKEGYT